MRNFPGNLSLVTLMTLGATLVLQTAAWGAPAPRGQGTPHHATVKPGAAMAFSHVLNAPARVGDVGTAVVTVSEDYDSGSLRLTARAGEGLELVSSENLTTLAMAGTGKHVVNIRFRALSEGVHYLNLIGEASDSTGQNSSRAFSMRVQIGKATAKAANPALAKDGKGGSIILMPATETIRN